MSVTTTVQALGWIPVVWLLAVHLLHDRGRLPDHALALRIAGFVAAATVVAGALATRMWPLAALGVLWLRGEVFAHRHRPAPEPSDPHAGPEVHWLEHDDDPAEPEPEPSPHPDDVLDDVRIHHGPAAVVRDHTIEALPVQTRSNPADELHAPPVRRSVPDRPRPSSAGHVPAPVALRSRPSPASRPSSGTRRAGAARTSATSRPAAKPAPRGFTARVYWVLSWLFKIEIVIAVVIALVLFGIWSTHQRGSFNDRANHSLCGLMGGC